MKTILSYKNNSVRS